MLKRQPQTVEEIADANNKHSDYASKTTMMIEKYEEAKRKDKTLANWTKERVEKLQQINSLWDNFSTLMDNHEQIVSKQVNRNILVMVSFKVCFFIL